MGHAEIFFQASDDSSHVFFVLFDIDSRHPVLVFALWREDNGVTKVIKTFTRIDMRLYEI